MIKQIGEKWRGFWRMASNVALSPGLRCTDARLSSRVLPYLVIATRHGAVPAEARHRSRTPMVLAILVDESAPLGGAIHLIATVDALADRIASRVPPTIVPSS